MLLALLVDPQLIENTQHTPNEEAQVPENQEECNILRHISRDRKDCWTSDVKNVQKLPEADPPLLVHSEEV